MKRFETMIAVGIHHQILLAHSCLDDVSSLLCTRSPGRSAYDEM